MRSNSSNHVPLRTSNRIAGSNDAQRRRTSRPTSKSPRSKNVASSDGPTSGIISNPPPRQTRSRIADSNDDQTRRIWSQLNPETSGTGNAGRRNRCSIPDRAEQVNPPVSVRDVLVADEVEAEVRASRKTRIRCRSIRRKAVNLAGTPDSGPNRRNLSGLPRRNQAVVASSSSSDDRRQPRMAEGNNDSADRAVLPRVGQDRFAARVLRGMSGRGPSNRRLASPNHILARIPATRSDVRVAMMKVSIARKWCGPSISGGAVLPVLRRGRLSAC